MKTSTPSGTPARPLARRFGEAQGRLRAGSEGCDLDHARSASRSRTGGSSAGIGAFASRLQRACQPGHTLPDYGSGKRLSLRSSGSKSLRVSGVVLADQVKSLDWRARKVTRICAVPAEVIAHVMRRL